jgi:uncharacterized protein (TIGR02646 family)
MRLITKNLNQQGYQPLITETPPTSSPEATARWNDFKEKTLLQSALLEDQHHLCCYSEINANEFGWGYHIEHIENKSQNHSLTFELSNLAASALSDQDLKNLKPIKKNAFGGHAIKKTKGVDMSLFIHCHQPNCLNFFAYLSNGYVVPANGLNEQEQSRAQYTIEHLNLNSPVLQLRRQQWHEELEVAYNAAKTDQTTIQDLINFYVKPLNNKLQQFVTMSEQFFASATIIT